jgi:tetratricopeptide (TPR) repeat protein
VAIAVFAAASAAPETAAEHYRVARDYMSEAKRSSNGIRLAWLGWNIGDELEEAVRLDPNLIDARLDLVRFYVVAPRVVGGSVKKARTQASEIAKRDVALGAFAYGYIAYRDKSYGPARVKLREAVRLATKSQTKTLALSWLGWLSQETQQYDVAFDAWREVIAIDPARVDALYEIGRTAYFARRDLDRGEDAVRRYLAATRTADMPSEEDARALLEKIRALR